MSVLAALIHVLADAPGAGCVSGGAGALEASPAVAARAVEPTHARVHRALVPVHASPAVSVELVPVRTLAAVAAVGVDAYAAARTGAVRANRRALVVVAAGGVAAGAPRAQLLEEAAADRGTGLALGRRVC